MIFQAFCIFEELNVTKLINLVIANSLCSRAVADTAKIIFTSNNKGYTCTEILQLLERYEVRKCFYGHLHGGSHGLAIEGLWNGVEYKLVSADRLNFDPYTVIS